MFQEMISAAEDQMKARLKEVRAAFANTGDKGNAVEDAFRSFLCQYLPRRLEVGQGEIIDSNGRRSSQTDVVVVSEDHPYTFTPDQPGLFFVDGVLAAGEVKTKLTSMELNKALKNSKRFKKLEMVIRGNIASTTESDINRFFRCPPWFLIAFESQLTLSSIHKKIVEFQTVEVIDDNRLIDAVFILDCGWIINFGDGQGAYKLKTLEGTSIPGFVYKESNSVLFDLLGWLSVVMPQMVRLSPILPNYILQRPKSR